MEPDREAKLIAYEKMHQAVQKEYETIVGKLEEMKAAGKVKSVTYQQYLARKLTYQNMLSLYELYDLKL